MKLFNRKKVGKAYILEIRNHPDMSTLVLERNDVGAIYYPFNNQKDIEMALELLKDAGIKIERTETVSIEA